MEIGVDIVDLVRFEKALERTPELRSRLSTDAEAALSLESMAGRFAAKEAFVKALKAPAGMSWQDIEVVIDKAGAPSSPCTVLPWHEPVSSASPARTCRSATTRLWRRPSWWPSAEGAQMATALPTSVPRRKR